MYDDEHDDPPGILTMKIGEVARKTSLPTATVWGLVDQGKFPLPINFTPGRSCWLLREVDEWISARAAEPRHSPFRTTDRPRARPPYDANERVVAFPSRQSDGKANPNQPPEERKRPPG